MKNLADGQFFITLLVWGTQFLIIKHGELSLPPRWSPHVFASESSPSRPRSQFSFHALAHLEERSFHA